MRTMNSRRVKAAKSSPRRREQKLHRQEEILGAAFKVFAAHGYEATRMDEVARQGGIAKGTIYLYFRDKEQLFRAVVRGLVQKKFDAMAGSFQGTGEQLLRELLSRMYGQVVRNEKVRSIVRLLIAESGRFPQLAEIYHREIIAPGMRAVRRAHAWDHLRRIPENRGRGIPPASGGAGSSGYRVEIASRGAAPSRP